MIKGRAVLVAINEVIGGVTKLNLETYIDEKASVCLNSFLGDMPWEGQDVVIMTKEEYGDSVDDFVRKRDSLIDENEKLREENKKLNRELNEKQENIFNKMMLNDAEQACLREKISRLEEENKTMDSTSNVLRQSLLDEREKTRKLEAENEAIQKDIKDLEEKMAQEADEVDIRPGGTIIFRKKIVSELEKEVEKLEKSKSDMWLERNTLKAENERLQKQIDDLERSKKALDDEYIRRVSENMALEKKLERLQDAAEVNIHTDGPIVFRRLEEENKDLKKEDDEVKLKISDEFTLNITSGLLYKED